MKTTTSTARSCARWHTFVLGTTLLLEVACGGAAPVPQIMDFSPIRGTVATEISIRGQHFDRDGRGYPLANEVLPWRVFLQGADRRWELLVAQATEQTLLVTVPEGARSGTIILADDQGVISESAASFEVAGYPTIRLSNDAQYDVVDLRLNGEQVLVDNKVLESGVSAAVSVTTGRYRIDYGLGDPKQVWVRGSLHGIQAGDLGTEVIAHIPPLELVDVLTNGRSATDWVAELRDSSGGATTVTLRVYGDGGWALFDGAVPRQEGQLVAATVAPYSQNIAFRITDNGETAKMAPPFSSFDLKNGPSHWPLLRYIRQP